jgi:phage terminase large subunit GpA-like protein
MADWFSAQGNKIKMRDFCNKHRAIPWTDYTISRKAEEVLALKDTRPAGIVPEDAVALTIGIDTQQFGFWYEVRAWQPSVMVVEIEEGRRDESVSIESWQIRGGFVESFTALSRVIVDDVYVSASGKRFVINLGVMDAMGDKTSEVYDFCRKFRNHIFPFQGVRSMTQPYSFSKIEYYPGTQKLIPGAMTLLRGNTTYYKNKLAGKLDIAPGDPGAWWFNADTTKEWGKHMTAEYVGDHGWWECRPNTPNHGWDCSVYNLVAADVLGVQFMIQESSAVETASHSPAPAKNMEAPNVIPERRRGKESRW